MKADIKKKWVEALRSGDYEQCSGGLRTGDKYCCLGVLCDLSSKDGAGVWTDHGGRAYEFSIKDDGHSSVLPEFVCNWAGLNSNSHGGCNPYFLIPKQRAATTLSGENDSGKTFAEIADLIEEHF